MNSSIILHDSYVIKFAIVGWSCLITCVTPHSNVGESLQCCIVSVSTVMLPVDMSLVSNRCAFLDGPVRNTGKTRSKRPKSKRPRKVKRPGRKTRGRNRLSPSDIQSLPVKTSPSGTHAPSNQARQNTRLTTTTETKTAPPSNRMSTGKVASRPVATRGAVSVKTGPLSMQGLAGRYSPSTRTWRPQTMAVPQRPMSVMRDNGHGTQQAASGPRRTWIGPERKPLACYQLERDQLRLLLVAWMKSQADRNGECDVTT